MLAVNASASSNTLFKFIKFILSSLVQKPDSFWYYGEVYSISSPMSNQSKRPGRKSLGAGRKLFARFALAQRGERTACGESRRTAAKRKSGDHVRLKKNVSSTRSQGGTDL